MPKKKHASYIRSVMLPTYSYHSTSPRSPSSPCAPPSVPASWAQLAAVAVAAGARPGFSRPPLHPTAAAAPSHARRLGSVPSPAAPLPCPPSPAPRQRQPPTCPEAAQLPPPFRPRHRSVPAKGSSSPAPGQEQRWRLRRLRRRKQQVFLPEPEAWGKKETGRGVPEKASTAARASRSRSAERQHAPA